MKREWLSPHDSHDNGSFLAEITPEFDDAMWVHLMLFFSSNEPLNHLDTLSAFRISSWFNSKQMQLCIALLILRTTLKNLNHIWNWVASLRWFYLVLSSISIAHSQLTYIAVQFTNGMHPRGNHANHPFIWCFALFLASSLLDIQNGLPYVRVVRERVLCCASENRYVVHIRRKM